MSLLNHTRLFGVVAVNKSKINFCYIAELRFKVNPRKIRLMSNTTKVCARYKFKTLTPLLAKL
jgi:hypothetical protein